MASGRNVQLLVGRQYQPQEIDAWVGRAEDEIAEETAKFALHQVKGNLHVSLQHPSGFYESRVDIYRMQGDPVVSDGGVIYGAWLEGVGSRNSPVTRFRGYASFRRARQATQAAAQRIAMRVLRPYLRRYG